MNNLLSTHRFDFLDYLALQKHWMCGDSEFSLLTCPQKDSSQRGSWQSFYQEIPQFFCSSSLPPPRQGLPRQFQWFLKSLILCFSPLDGQSRSIPAIVGGASNPPNKEIFKKNENVCILLTIASVISFKDQGNVPTLNCMALKMERMVKASEVASSTPARVIVMKVAKPATMVIEGDTVVLTDCNKADFRSSLISRFRSASTLCSKNLL